jgi:hypothetical protein
MQGIILKLKTKIVVKIKHMIPIVHPIRLKTSFDISYISNIVKHINEGNVLELKDISKNKFLILTLDNIVDEGLFVKSIIKKNFGSDIIKYNKAG